MRVRGAGCVDANANANANANVNVIVNVIVIVIGFVAEDDPARFFGIARGSAMECSAIIDCCGVIGAAEQHDAEEANALLERVVAMLTRMCR